MCQNISTICASDYAIRILSWTDFIHARLENRNNQLWVQPARLESALLSMAQKEALIIIPEDLEEIAAGKIIDIQLLPSESLIPGHFHIFNQL